MIQSMTGFGKAELQVNGIRLQIELRSLNSKSFDFKARLPQAYQEKEIEIKEIVQKTMIRGKVDLSINLDYDSGKEGYTIQEGVVKNYLQQLEQIEAQTGRKASQAIEYILRLPEVLKPAEVEADDQEYKEVLNGLAEALKRMVDFRSTEGKKLFADLEEHIDNIESRIARVEALKEERLEKRKQNLMQKFEETKLELDENRFEQEMIFYIEKLDINEELVRLKSHCEYFKETMNHSDAQGRKLGFIGQEIGREINTLGAKAYHSEIQKIVVEMKDELEKIKEQSLNVL